jgi:hypothetical protein
LFISARSGAFDICSAAWGFASFCADIHAASDGQAFANASSLRSRAKTLVVASSATAQIVQNRSFTGRSFVYSPRSQRAASIAK